MKRVKKYLLALAAILVLCGVISLQAFAAETGETHSYEGKVISILGDSISTYSGVSNDASVNATLNGGAIYYTPGRLDIYRADTWWQQAIDALGMELLVNNSWSGSCVLSSRSGTVGAYLDRCVQLHNDATGEEPDVIVIFIGTNDFSYYQSTLGTADIDYDALIFDDYYATPTTTCEAYAIMLDKIISRYPDAEIYCMGMTARRTPDKEDSYADVGQPTAFNAELKKIIEHFGITYVDLENCGIDTDAKIFDTYMGDGRVHPNALGMDKITEALLTAMLGSKSEICNVTYDLSMVQSDNTAETVLIGSTYEANLRAESSMTVTVTVGGKDVTASCYSDGKITIANVTDDITITVTARKNPSSYRWELDGNTLVSVGSNKNTPTLGDGAINNGIMQNAWLELEEPVILRHDLPWAVEFKVSGNWYGMILSEEKNADIAGNTFLFKTAQTNGFIGFGERTYGQYENYGIALKNEGVDISLEHIYRLENRIAADGSNMVYLFIDGYEIGAMNNFFIGGSNDQSKTVDWISGRDFTFFYIGASGHTMNNCRLDYLTVTECDHTYENGVCTGCGNTLSPIITKQPASCEVAFGERFTFTAEAEGYSVIYQWFYSQNSKEFIKSSVTGNTYSFDMTDYRLGREYYCLITDKHGNAAKTDTVKATVPLSVSGKLDDVQAEIGETVTISANVVGEGVSYQWYYKDRSSAEFAPSSFTEKTYSVTMTDYRNGREVYCVITDAYGNTYTTETATMSTPPADLKILSQPENVSAEIGERFNIRFTAQGDKLTYQWYYKESYMKEFTLSSNKTPSYSYDMTDYRDGREVYCVITDEHGNTVTTDTVTITLTK